MKGNQTGKKKRRKEGESFVFRRMRSTFMVKRVRAGRWWVAVVAGLLLGGGARAAAVDEAVEARLRKDVTFLASDECEGRGVSTKGINLAAEYVAHEFKKAGLKPAGPGA